MDSHRKGDPAREAFAENEARKERFFQDIMTELDHWDNPALVEACKAASIELRDKSSSFHEVNILLSVKSVLRMLRSLQQKLQEFKGGNFHSKLERLLIDEISVATAEFQTCDRTRIETSAIRSTTIESALYELEIPERIVDAANLRVSKAEIDRHLSSENEVGGAFCFTRDGNVLGLDFRHTATGDDRSIDIREHKHLKEDELGTWHTHPSENGLPIPSFNDLIAPNMRFIFRPSIILSQRGSRLYLPRIYYAMLDEQLQRQAVQYEPKDRADELRQYWDNEDMIEFGNNACAGLHYLDLSSYFSK